MSYCLGILTLPMGYATVQGWWCGGSEEIQSTLKSWWGSMLGSGYSILEYRYARSDDEMFPFQFKRKQFPIRLSFAMTVNKS